MNESLAFSADDELSTARMHSNRGRRSRGHSTAPIFRPSEALNATFSSHDPLFKVADKIEDVRTDTSGRGKALVYCRAGMSRSATLCVAYFMKYHDMAMQEALQFVKTRRPIIAPNVGFLRQLRDFEKGLSEQRRLIEGCKTASQERERWLWDHVSGMAENSRHQEVRPTRKRAAFSHQAAEMREMRVYESEENFHEVLREPCVCVVQIDCSIALEVVEAVTFEELLQLSNSDIHSEEENAILSLCDDFHAHSAIHQDTFYDHESQLKAAELSLNRANDSIETISTYSVIENESVDALRDASIDEEAKMKCKINLSCHPECLILTENWPLETVRHLPNVGEKFTPSSLKKTMLTLSGSKLCDIWVEMIFRQCISVQHPPRAKVSQIEEEDCSMREATCHKERIHFCRQKQVQKHGNRPKRSPQMKAKRKRDNVYTQAQIRKLRKEADGNCILS